MLGGGDLKKSIHMNTKTSLKETNKKKTEYRKKKNGIFSFSFEFKIQQFREERGEEQAILQLWCDFPFFSL